MRINTHLYNVSSKLQVIEQRITVIVNKRKSESWGWSRINVVKQLVITAPLVVGMLGVVAATRKQEENQEEECLLGKCVKNCIEKTVASCIRSCPPSSSPLFSWTWSQAFTLSHKRALSLARLLFFFFFLFLSLNEMRLPFNKIVTCLMFCPGFMYCCYMAPKVQSLCH